MKAYQIVTLCLLLVGCSPKVITTEVVRHDTTTNREDLAILKSEQGKRQIVDLHVEGIISYIEGYEN